MSRLGRPQQRGILWSKAFDVYFEAVSLTALFALLLAPLIPELGFQPFVGLVWLAMACKALSLALAKDGDR